LERFDGIHSSKNLRKDLKSIRGTLVDKATLFSPDYLMDKETAISVVNEFIGSFPKGIPSIM